MYIYIYIDIRVHIYIYRERERLIYMYIRRGRLAHQRFRVPRRGRRGFRGRGVEVGQFSNYESLNLEFGSNKFLNKGAGFS